MKEKVLISRKRLCELENIELNYKMMENAVNVAQERSKKLAVRNMELINVSVLEVCLLLSDRRQSTDYTQRVTSSCFLFLP